MTPPPPGLHHRPGSGPGEQGGQRQAVLRQGLAPGEGSLLPSSPGQETHDKLEGAVEDCSRCVRLDPECGPAWLTGGELRLRKEDYPGAGLALPALTASPARPSG